MAGSKEFLDQFGSETFEDRPFCDGDAIAFCEISYMPLKGIVPESFDEEPVNLPEAYYKVFAARGYKHGGLGLMITPAPSVRLMQMAESQRYKDIKVYAVKDVYSLTPALQFTAMTFLLPDGTAVIAFEGTDDTLAGWKEDADMLLHKGSPAYELAMEYLNGAAAKFDGDLILVGHSKGGHEALYAALHCSPEIRNRIRYLYNNDGPGFFTDAFFKTGAYDELKDRYRHFVPYSSFIGMLLCHDNDYIAVDSTKHFGPVQHDMGTWQIENGWLVRKNDIDFLGKLTDVFFEKLVSNTDESHYEALDKYLTDLILGTGQETLTNLAKNAVSSVKGAKNALDKIDPEVKDTVKSILKISGKLAKESFVSVKNGAKEKVETVRTLVTEH